MCLGIPGKVVEVHHQEALPMGTVQFGGITKEVCLAYVPEVRIGDYVLVHVGFALSVLDESEAQEVFSYIEQIATLAQHESPATEDSASATRWAETEP